MISCLVIIVLILAFFQSSHDRGVVAVIYAGVCGVHSLLFYEFDNGYCLIELSPKFYYLSAAICDIAIIIAIAMVTSFSIKPTRLADNLMDICLISIVLNAIGLVLMRKGLPLELYSLSYGALYLIAIRALLREDCANGYQSSKRNSRIRLSVRSCVEYCRQLQEKKT